MANSSIHPVIASTSSLAINSPSTEQANWIKVALLVTSIVLIIGITAFGGVGIFASQSMLPQSIAHAVGTVGYNGCMGMFILGGVSLPIALLVKKICSVKHDHPIGNLETAKVCDSAMPNLELENELLNAAKVCDITKIIDLLKKGVDSNCKDASGFSPLAYVSEFQGNHLEDLNVFRDQIYLATQVLLDYGANPDILCPSNNTPLYLAVSNFNPDVAKVLIEKGAKQDSFIEDDSIASSHPPSPRSLLLRFLSDMYESKNENNCFYPNGDMLIRLKIIFKIEERDIKKLIE